MVHLQCLSVLHCVLYIMFVCDTLTILSQRARQPRGHDVRRARVGHKSRAWSLQVYSIPYIRFLGSTFFIWQWYFYIVRI
jgi:hypothetical protein